MSMTKSGPEIWTCSETSLTLHKVSAEREPPLWTSVTLPGVGWTVFWEYELNPWDMAAGALIVQEAGGSVTKMDGSDFALFNREVLASNGHIHSAMQDQLKR